jgi:hypothetical protein
MVESAWSSESSRKNGLIRIEGCGGWARSGGDPQGLGPKEGKRDFWRWTIIRNYQLVYTGFIFH